MLSFEIQLILRVPASWLYKGKTQEARTRKMSCIYETETLKESCI